MKPYLRTAMALIFAFSIHSAKADQSTKPVVSAISDIKGVLAVFGGKEIPGINQNQKDALIKIMGIVNNSSSLTIQIYPVRTEELSDGWRLEISPNSSLLGKGTESDSKNGNVTSIWQFTKPNPSYPNETYIDTVRVTKEANGDVLSVEISTEGFFRVPVKTENGSGFDRKHLTRKSMINFNR